MSNIKEAKELVKDADPKEVKIKGLSSDGSEVDMVLADFEDLEDLYQTTKINAGDATIEYNGKTVEVLY